MAPENYRDVALAQVQAKCLFLLGDLDEAVRFGDDEMGRALPGEDSFLFPRREGAADRMQRRRRQLGDFGAGQRERNLDTAFDPSAGVADLTEQGRRDTPLDPLRRNLAQALLKFLEAAPRQFYCVRREHRVI